ncbi:MAG: cyclic nucleotide-binding domain-containing protein [Proteobacteria bacterium]|nr:MAG: cyclic nucleotide-binding domain-containing protein [Pseudomonadota bacterium]
MALTLCSTFSRTIIRLRLFAATSNILAIISSTAIGFWPSVIQNAVQLPLNIYRIREARRQVEKLRAAPVTGVHSGWLHPYARESTLFAGQVLFRKGDLGDRLYYLEAGSILFDEINVEIHAGTLFGEIAFFTRDGRRTQTAIATSECRLLSIDGDQLKQLYFQNPEFGWYLIQLIAQRLTAPNHRAP